MASIGSFSVTAFRGRLRHAQQRIAVLDPNPGTDGAIVALSGWSSEPTTIDTAVNVASDSAARSLIESYRDSHGDIITVVDQFGETWANVVIIGVSSQYSATPVSTVWRVEASWRLLVESTRP